MIVRKFYFLIAYYSSQHRPRSNVKDNMQLKL